MFLRAALIVGAARTMLIVIHNAAPFAGRSGRRFWLATKPRPRAGTRSPPLRRQRSLRREIVPGRANWRAIVAHKWQPSLRAQAPIFPPAILVAQIASR